MRLDEFLYVVRREAERERMRQARTHDRQCHDDARVKRCSTCGAWKYGRGPRCATCQHRRAAA